MSAKRNTRRTERGQESVEQLLAQGHRFHAVTLENCQLVVLARNVSEAIGVFRTWFEQVWQDVIFYGLNLASTDFQITTLHWPPRGSQVAIFGGYRGGSAQVYVLSV